LWGLLLALAAFALVFPFVEVDHQHWVRRAVGLVSRLSVMVLAGLALYIVFLTTCIAVTSE
jgi:hypothetical protein